MTQGSPSCFPHGCVISLTLVLHTSFSFFSSTTLLKAMDLGYGAEVLDSTHAFADTPGPSSHIDEEEDPTPSVHPNFNFELVVFQVGEILFRVIKNGFQVPGTIFEAMFALPVSGDIPVEGGSLDSPIVLEGVDERHFQVFLRALYPFIGQPTVTKYEDWVGVLQLATMWEFTEIREKAIAALSALNPERELTEKISIGAQYGIVDWLRDGYTDLVQRPTLKIEDLRGSPFPITWEAAAKIYCARESLLPNFSNYSCCGGSYYGPSYSNPPRHCRCRMVAAVNRVFEADFEAMKDNPVLSAPPLPPNPEAEPSSKKNFKKGKKRV